MHLTHATSPHHIQLIHLCIDRNIQVSEIYTYNLKLDYIYILLRIIQLIHEQLSSNFLHSFFIYAVSGGPSYCSTKANPTSRWLWGSKYVSKLVHFTIQLLMALNLDEPKIRCFAIFVMGSQMTQVMAVTKSLHAYTIMNELANPFIYGN